MSSGCSAQDRALACRFTSPSGETKNFIFSPKDYGFYSLPDAAHELWIDKDIALGFNSDAAGDATLFNFKAQRQMTIRSYAYSQMAFAGSSPLLGIRGPSGVRLILTDQMQDMPPCSQAKTIIGIHPQPHGDLILVSFDEDRTIDYLQQKMDGSCQKLNSVLYAPSLPPRIVSLGLVFSSDGQFILNWIGFQQNSPDTVNFIPGTSNLIYWIPIDGTAPNLLAQEPWGMSSMYLDIYGNFDQMMLLSGSSHIAKLLIPTPGIAGIYSIPTPRKSLK